MEDSRTQTSESAKQGDYEVTETEAAMTGPAWVYPRSSVYVLQTLELSIFIRLLTGKTSDSYLFLGLFSSC